MLERRPEGLYLKWESSALPGRREGSVNWLLIERVGCDHSVNRMYMTQAQAGDLRRFLIETLSPA